MPIERASTALERFTVLDLTRVRAGPTCVRQLADWGADVIRIEAPAALKENMGGARDGSDFQNLHRNKRSLCLDLKSEKGRDIFLALAEKADVVVENFRPDVKRRLGIDYETLSAKHPGIVYASISGFGEDGPYRERPGFDQIAQGLGGLMSITGHPDGGPMRVGIPIADLTAGIFAAQAILIALLERERSGKGQWVRTSLLQAQLFMLDFQAARWLMDGKVPGQAGNDHPTSIPTGVFPTKDGVINIATAGGHIWERFCRVIGRDDLIENPDYATDTDRSANREALNAAIAAETARATTAEWVERLNEAGVPAGPINRMDQVFEDPQVEHLGMVQPIRTAERGDTRMQGQPITMSRTPSRLAARPPLQGEHADEILTELGYAEDDIAALRDEGVI